MRSILIAALLAMLTGCGGSDPIPSAQAAEVRPTVLLFGDSITAGYIPTDGFLQLRQDLSFPALLKSRANVITAAVGGATSEHGRYSQAAWLKGVQADVVVAMFGINDAFAGITPAQTVEHLDAIMQQWPRARRIVIAEPLWSEATRASQSELERLIRARSISWGAKYIDLYTPSADIRPYCTQDRHPCADWHASTAAAVGASL